MDQSFDMKDYKLYPNPYLIVTSDGRYTKHYFDCSTRIASRIATGTDVFQQRPAGQPKNRESKVVDPSTDLKTYLEKAGLGDAKISTEFAKAPAPTADLYYLHGDHLGTASYVTDENGETTQFFLNLPFGETMAEQNLPGAYENPYKFNAKELDVETGLYYYGARYYNPKLSIWYAVDPLAEKMPSWSPYVYTFNNPINFIDPDGRIPYPITIRGFASFKKFGFGFHGDGRGYSTGNFSARVHQKINFDTDKTTITTKAWSSSTYKVDNPSNSKTAIPSVNFTGDFTISNNGDNKTFGFGSHVAAANPLTPPGSPNIDIFSNFSVTENKKAGTLNVSGKLTGDNFPSTEAFMTDPNGNKVFIGVGQIGAEVDKDWGPFTQLPGENSTNPITTFNFTISTDKKGNFTRVTEGKTTYSITNWNKRFNSQPTQKKK